MDKRLILPLLMAGAMMDTVFGGSSATTVFKTNSDPTPSTEIVDDIKRKAEEKRLRKMHKRLKGVIIQ